MAERFFKIDRMVSEQNQTARKVVSRTQIHEIDLWRVKPGEWIYPHIHPRNDDIWYFVHGEGEYYFMADETKKVKAGDIAVAAPGSVHGIFNSGREDIIVYSVLSPLPVEIEPAPGFEYPE